MISFVKTWWIVDEFEKYILCFVVDLDSRGNKNVKG